MERLWADSMVPLLHGVLAYGPCDLVDAASSLHCISKSMLQCNPANYGVSIEKDTADA